MGKKYTDEELIAELQRFHRENGRVPTMFDMDIARNGYPSCQAYKSHFKTWNNALETANLPLNQYQDCWQDGTETCSYCEKRADEIPNFTQWRYHDGIRYCSKHGNSHKDDSPDYVTGNLDINSEVGRGRSGEILVLKKLEIGTEFDYNRISCGYKFDLYHKKYGKIDVKTSLFSHVSNRWFFNFYAKKEADTYICIGLSSYRKTVEHVWTIPNEGKIRHQQSLTITNSYSPLLKNSKWEVDSRPYNDIWKTMKLKTCNSMTDKSKSKVKLTWEETLKALAELNKKYGVKK